MTTFKPKPFHVIVKRDKSKTQTKSGLFVPDTAQKVRNTGMVIGVSEFNEGYVKEGDRVVFPTFCAKEFIHEGDTFLTMEEEECIAKLD